MPEPCRTRKTFLLGVCALMGAGCADLFHATDWSTRCDLNHGDPACAAVGTAGATAGGGGAGGAAGGSASGNGGGQGGTCMPGFAGDGHSCIDVATALTGARWEIPCTTDYSANVCIASAMAPVTTTLGGTMGSVYDVKLRIRGVVEAKTYSGGTNDGAYWQVGGTPATDAFNVYWLDVASPAQTYFINRGMSGIYQCDPLDYQATITVSAGTTVTLHGDVVDTHEIKNLDAMAMPIAVPGVPPYPQAYNGQFAQIDVVSVVQQ